MNLHLIFLLASFVLLACGNTSVTEEITEKQIVNASTVVTASLTDASHGLTDISSTTSNSKTTPLVKDGSSISIAPNSNLPETSASRERQTTIPQIASQTPQPISINELPTRTFSPTIVQAKISTINEQTIPPQTQASITETKSITSSETAFRVTDGLSHMSKSETNKMLQDGTDFPITTKSNLPITSAASSKELQTTMLQITSKTLQSTNLNSMTSSNPSFLNISVNSTPGFTMLPLSTSRHINSSTLEFLIPSAETSDSHTSLERSTNFSVFTSVGQSSTRMIFSPMFTSNQSTPAQNISSSLSKYFESPLARNSSSTWTTLFEIASSVGLTSATSTKAISPTTFQISTTSPIKGEGKCFLTYGTSVGDTVGNFIDKHDGYLEVYLPEPFLIGSKYYKKTFINVNGFISFNDPVIAIQPWGSDPLSRMTESPVIAPFWADIDLNDFQSKKNQGKIYYRCISRYTKYSNVSDSRDWNVYNIVKSKISEYIDFTGSFKPTMVCSFTWSNVSPYPFNEATSNEIATFQLVITSDNSNGRSFAVFSYEYFNWNFRRNAQGYKMDDSYRYQWNEIDWKYYFYTSGEQRAFHLPKLIGPRGSPGQWYFRLSFPTAELQHQSSFQCYAWYDQELQTGSDWSFWLPECPCNLWQAMVDPSYKYHSLQWNSRLACFITKFPRFQTSTQKCCYEYNFFHWTWNWWWWSPGRFMSFSWLDTMFTYDSGSSLKYHPDYYRDLYFKEDERPKRLCCLESNNCDLYYRVRPKNYCWRYWRPFFGFMFGDPHITTLDGFPYTFNGWGEFWMIKSSVLKVQARTSLFVNSNGSIGNATVFTGFAFKDDTENFTSSRICVVLSQDRNTMIIKENDNSDNITEWFYSNKSANGTEYDKLKNLSIRLNNATLVISFPSGVQADVEVAEKTLKLTLSVPNSAKDFNFKGLYGAFDGDPHNDFTFPNGTVISQNSTERQIFEFGNSWAISKSEDSLFWYNSSNNETFHSFQHPDFVPIFTDELDGSCKINKTIAEQNCFLNNKTDNNCLYDYCVTGDRAFAEATKQTTQDVIKTQESLKNSYVPIIIVPLDYQNFTVNTTAIIDIIINSTDYSFNLSIENIATLNTNLSCQDALCHTWKLQATPRSLDEFNLTLYGNDSNGKSANPVSLSVNMCDCSGRGSCLWNQVSQSINPRYKIVECSCRNGVYSGNRCENVIDYCLNKPCSFNRTCTNLNESQLISMNNDSSPFKGYACSDCPKGSQKDQMDRCIDIDECNSSIPVCDITTEICVNKEFSYECTCKPGYQKNNKNNKCEDVDECKMGLSNCEQTCQNTEGSFSCSCFDGYLLQNQRCLKQSNCTINDGCHFCNSNSSCLCGMGYNITGNICIDINECDIPSTCDSTSSLCKNTNGSYICDCLPGYYKKESISPCQPCEQGMYGLNCNQTCNCSPKRCSTSNGCIECDSKGWKPPSCTDDIDECALNPKTCGNGNCTNTVGSYKCNCEPWFSFTSGINCTIVDACKYNRTVDKPALTTCQNNAKCVNGTDPTRPGIFYCECPPGYGGNGCEIAENVTSISKIETIVTTSYTSRGDTFADQQSSTTSPAFSTKMTQTSRRSLDQSTSIKSSGSNFVGMTSTILLSIVFSAHPLFSMVIGLKLLKTGNAW